MCSKLKQLLTKNIFEVYYLSYLSCTSRLKTPIDQCLISEMRKSNMIWRSKLRFRKVQLESKYVVISLCEYIQTLIVLQVHRNLSSWHPFIQTLLEFIGNSKFSRCIVILKLINQNLWLCIVQDYKRHLTTCFICWTYYTHPLQTAMKANCWLE